MPRIRAAIGQPPDPPRPPKPATVRERPRLAGELLNWHPVTPDRPAIEATARGATCTVVPIGGVYRAWCAERGAFRHW